MEGEEPTQATQNVLDPRRLGHQNTGFSDDVISDIICILYPHSDSARLEVQRLVQQGSPFVIGKDMADGVEPNYDVEDRASQFDSDTVTHGNYAIILRLSTAPKNPTAGFAFGRNPGRCDVVFANDPLRRVSNIHFRIYVNEFGNVMIEDQSTNGTFVDRKLLSARAKPGLTQQASRWVLSSGSVINIFLHDEFRDLTFRVRIPRREGRFEQAYAQNVLDYFVRHRLPLEGGAPPVNPPTTEHVDLFRTAAQPLAQRPHARGQMQAPAAPRLAKQTSTREWTGSGKYNKVRAVGKGAFAVVYKVTAKYDGRPYAAKELEKRHFIKNGVLDQKVENEMRIMQRLNHPNIVRYIENFDWDERIFIIIMEFVAHGDLGKLIAENGPFTEGVTQVLAVQLLSALRYLHNFNITHRDIKPDNILISSLDPLEVKLTDFGLSKMIDSEQTFLRTFCGTLLYCAPEVYNEYVEYDENGHRTRGRPSRRPPGQRYSHAVDIWSLGGVLFYCLTGAAPYPTRSVASPSELLHRVMTTPLNMAPFRHHGVSQAGIDFIRSMLQPRPENRATIDELQCHPWLTDLSETIQASQSFDEVTDDEEFPGQASQFSQQRYEEDRVSDSMDEDSDQENCTIVPGGQPRRLFGEVGVSAIGSSGVFPEEYLNLPSDGEGEAMTVEMLDVNTDGVYGSVELIRSLGDNAHNQPGVSIFPNQSMDQLQSLVEEVASQSLGGNDKKSVNSPSSPRQSMASLDPNTSKRKPSSAETSEEFDENTPPGKPTIKRLRSESHVDTPVTDEMIEEYKLLASIPPINPQGVARSSDGPVIKAQFWTDDISTWHLDYPEMTSQQLAKFNDAASQRREIFRPHQTPLWELAMKYFPPTQRPSSQATESHTMSAHDILIRGHESLDTGGQASPDGSQDVHSHSKPRLVVPIPTAELAAVIESDPTSCITGISLHVTEPLLSFGRGPENTNVYEHKSVTRVPKYAFQILLWKEGYDPGKYELPWRTSAETGNDDDFFFWISTRATNGIRINGRQLRSSNTNPRDPSENWTRLYNGDSIVIWHDGSHQERKETKLAFRCSWGGSAKPRDPRLQSLELASRSIVHKLNAGCKRFESQRPKNRMRRKDEADIIERRQNAERERQRSVVFEQKRQEAISYLMSKQISGPRRFSPAAATRKSAECRRQL